MADGALEHDLIIRGRERDPLRPQGFLTCDDVRYSDRHHVVDLAAKQFQ